MESQYYDRRVDVAVFVDFENIYISVRNKYDVNPNFESIMDKCQEYGRVTIARAYADWYRYPRITNALYANSIEPIYVPTYYYDRSQGRTGKAIKNSVDIHLCIDAMRTLYTHPTIETYILITGDRDFIPLINAMRQHGKTVAVVGVAEAASSHLAQSADDFMFYRQLLDNGEKPTQAAKDPYAALVEAIHMARQRNNVCTLATLKLLMVEVMGAFDHSKYRDHQGKPFSKFKDFVREAERRGLVQIFTSGTVNEVFLPQEDPYELSQFAPEPPPSVEEPAPAPEDGLGPREWRAFEEAVADLNEPALFIQIYDSLRNSRNKDRIDLSNREIKKMIKQAINSGMLERQTKGSHAYYAINRSHPNWKAWSS
ncbi:MAG: NYN domain-containing protein [Anaerolineae bacterium]